MVQVTTITAVNLSLKVKGHSPWYLGGKAIASRTQTLDEGRSWDWDDLEGSLH